MPYVGQQKQVISSSSVQVRCCYLLYGLINVLHKNMCALLHRCHVTSFKEAMSTERNQMSYPMFATCLKKLLTLAKWKYVGLVCGSQHVTIWRPTLERAGSYCLPFPSARFKVRRLNNEDSLGAQIVIDSWLSKGELASEELHPPGLGEGRGSPACEGICMFLAAVLYHAAHMSTINTISHERH